MKSFNRIICLAIGIALMAIPMQAQESSVSLGNFYIPAEGQVAIFSNHNFEEVGTGLLSGIIATDRSEKQNGRLVFSSNSAWRNANEFSHVDGFVKSVGEGSFVFPTGDNGLYGPIGLSNAENVEAAYYAVDPSYAVTSKILSSEYTDLPAGGAFLIEKMTEGLEAISNQEYWDVNGTTETRITIPYSKYSDIEELSKSDLSNLTIVGWSGSEWIPIASSIDENALDISVSDLGFSEEGSNFFKGSITTDKALIPNTYAVYSLGRVNSPVPSTQNAMTFYPNPVKTGGLINVRYAIGESSGGVINVFNSANQLVLSQKLSTGVDKITLPMNGYDRGVYTMALTAGGKTVYKKLIVIDL